MRSLAIIPARYQSTRFPGKPLALICGKPMIQHVYERVKQVKELSDVYVATDDIRIYSTVESFGGKVIMTSDKHTCGTDRLAECSEIIGLSDDDIVLNIQGDEPLISPEMILDLFHLFDDKDVIMGTLKKEIISEAELDNPNVVKVVTDQFDNALYFSRYPIPYVRSAETKHFKHVGVYGYKKRFLMEYSRMDKTPLERAESLEQLRVLENGYKIRVKETTCSTIGVDTPEQIKEVEEKIREFEKDSLS